MLYKADNNINHCFVKTPRVIHSEPEINCQTNIVFLVPTTTFPFDYMYTLFSVTGSETKHIIIICIANTSVLSMMQPKSLWIS